MSQNTVFVPQRGDIIFIDHDPKSGAEIGKDHPLLVVSARALADRTSIVMGFPMTHAQQHKTNYLSLCHTWPDGEESFVLLWQIKTFDWRARNARLHPRGGGHFRLLDKALAEFNEIFQIKP